MSPRPQLLSVALPCCSACGRPARVLLALREAPLCPSCSRADGVELMTGRDLSASLALRLASAPTRDMPRRRRRPRMSEQQKLDMIANLNRLLAEGHVDPEIEVEVSDGP